MVIAISMVVSGNMERRTLYDDLGVPPGAERKDIERAFWCRQGGEKGASTGALSPAETAYLTLSDPDKRREYNRRIGIERHPAWEDGTSEASRADYLFHRALTLFQRGSENEALRFLKECHRLQPGNARFASMFGLLLSRTGRGFRQGLRLATEAHRRCPGDPDVAENLAAVYERAGLKRRAASIRSAFRTSSRTS